MERIGFECRICNILVDKLKQSLISKQKHVHNSAEIFSAFTNGCISGTEENDIWKEIPEKKTEIELKHVPKRISTPTKRSFKLLKYYDKYDVNQIETKIKPNRHFPMVKLERLKSLKTVIKSRRNSVKKNSCYFCGSKASSYQILRHHYRIHTREFISKASVEYGEVQHKTIEESKSLKSSVTVTTNLTATSENHLSIGLSKLDKSKTIMDESRRTSVNKNSCYFCGFKASSYKILRHHYRIHTREFCSNPLDKHGEVQHKIIEESKSPVNDNLNRDNQPSPLIQPISFVCDICGVTGVTQDDYNSHLKTHEFILEIQPDLEFQSNLEIQHNLEIQPNMEIQSNLEIQADQFNSSLPVIHPEQTHEHSAFCNLNRTFESEEDLQKNHSYHTVDYTNPLSPVYISASSVAPVLEPNLEVPEVSKFIADNVDYYYTECKISGFKIKTVNEIISHLNCPCGSQNIATPPSLEAEEQSPISPTEEEIHNTDSDSNQSSSKDFNSNEIAALYPKVELNYEQDPESPPKVHQDQFQCLKCNCSFVSVYMKLLHDKKNHRDSFSFKCSKCNLKFQTELRRNQHEKRHLTLAAQPKKLPVRREFKFKCSRCLVSFKTLVQKTRHEECHLDEIPTISASFPELCNTTNCNETDHEIAVNNEERVIEAMMMEPQLEEKLPTAEETDSDSIFVTPELEPNQSTPSFFVSESNLEIPTTIDPNVEQPEPTESYFTQDPSSSVAYSKWKGDIANALIKHNELFKCSRCTLTFPSKFGVARHEKSHGDNWLCELCPVTDKAGFEHKVGLTRHRKQVHFQTSKIKITPSKSPRVGNLFQNKLTGKISLPPGESSQTSTEQPETSCENQQSFEQLGNNINKANQELVEFLTSSTQIVDNLYEGRRIIDGIMFRKAPVSVDCKRVNLGNKQNNRMVTLVQVGIVDGLLAKAVLFDVQVEPMLGNELKRLLEAEDIVKVMHDCRADSASLYNQFGINLQYRSIFDTQSAHAVIRKHDDGKPIDLNSVCSAYGCFPNPFVDAVKPLHKNPRLWSQRPLSNLLISCAASSVLCLLPTLYNEMNKLISSEEDKKLMMERTDLSGQTSSKPEPVNTRSKQRQKPQPVSNRSKQRQKVRRKRFLRKWMRKVKTNASSSIN